MNPDTNHDKHQQHLAESLEHGINDPRLIPTHGLEHNRWYTITTSVCITDNGPLWGDMLIGNPGAR